jgi:hypothetical protein
LTGVGDDEAWLATNRDSVGRRRAERLGEVAARPRPPRRAATAARAGFGGRPDLAGRFAEVALIVFMRVGSQVAGALGQRAQAGAKMLYEFLSEKFGSHDTASAGKSANSTLATQRAAKGSQHTLRSDDLAPAWRGPLPHRDPRRIPPA